jgi:hypothetical protein
MPISRQQAWDGKAAEHIVISELLKRGHTPFIPIIDTGVDIIVKSKSKNCYYELQVKSNNSPIKDNQQWFVFTGELLVREELIYVLVDMVHGEFWLIPSKIVKRYGNQCRTQFDLHLQQKKRGTQKTRGEYLGKYKNSWDILK